MTTSVTAATVTARGNASIDGSYWDYQRLGFIQMLQWSGPLHLRSDADADANADNPVDSNEGVGNSSGQ